MNKLIAKLKSVKHKEIVLAVIALAVMLIIYFSSFAPKKKSSAAQTQSDYCLVMSEKIQSALSKMAGVGKTEVVINWSSGTMAVYEKNVTSNGNSTSEQVALSGGSPITLKEIYPRAIGVMIVCEGGSNAKVKIDVKMAVSALLDISADKVLVFGTK